MLPTLQADFKADLLAIARQQLSQDWGAEAQQNPEDDLVMTYIDSLRRRPAVRRNLDGLLNEWGVHHLHLGAALSASGHVERSGPVLIARITDDDFFAINIFPHGAWEDISILESLHRNWPDTIRRYRLMGVKGEPLNASQRRRIRHVNLQAATTVSDGTVYMSIGGGVVSAVISAEAVRASDMLSQDTMLLQTAIERQREKFIPLLQARGYTGTDTVKATLAGVTSQGFLVDFPEYGVRSNVTLEGGCFHSRQGVLNASWLGE